MTTPPDPNIAALLAGKTEVALSLYDHFIAVFKTVGPIKLHGTKTMIAIGKDKSTVYVIKLGKAFVDVVFIFDKPHADNLCFTKIAQVPNSNQYNHHLRILDKSDVNGEVRKFMGMAFE